MVSFSAEASDSSKIRATVEFKIDGYPPGTRVLEFGSGAPYPPAAKFKDGVSFGEVESAISGYRALQFNFLGASFLHDTHP